MLSSDNSTEGSQSNSSANASNRNKRKSPKQRMPVFPPVPPGSDAHLRKVWLKYWEARSWQHRHQVACWRSQVEALQFENHMLHEYIKALLTGGPGNSPSEMQCSSDGRIASLTSSYKSKRNRKKRIRRKRKARSREQSLNESDSEHYSDVDEEFLKFMEQTIRHRLERDNHPLLERNRNKNRNEDVKEDPDSGLKSQETLARSRVQQMEELFGPETPKLLAMETAMQLTFNSNCDRHRPKPWPVLPLATQP